MVRPQKDFTLVFRPVQRHWRGAEREHISMQQVHSALYGAKYDNGIYFSLQPNCYKGSFAPEGTATLLKQPVCPET
jgi:hypothetical protein